MKRRRSSDGRRSIPKTSRKKLDCLDVLTGDEASAVLRKLLSSYPELLPNARHAANALLATVSCTDVANCVFEALLALGLDDLDAGPRAAAVVSLGAAAPAHCRVRSLRSSHQNGIGSFGDGRGLMPIASPQSTRRELSSAVARAPSPPLKPSPFYRGWTLGVEELTG